MDQSPKAASPPAGWLDSIARGEADLAEGRVTAIDVDALCREIEAEADDIKREASSTGRVLYAQFSPTSPAEQFSMVS